MNLSDPAEGQRTFERLRAVATQYLDVGLKDAGALPNDSALVDAVREQFPNAQSESFVPPVLTPQQASGGRIRFSDSEIEIDDDGTPLLGQAEAAGLTPESGCRMGICFSCTRRKNSGAVRNVITGAVSSTDEEDVQICVSAPVGDVDIAL